MSIADKNQNPSSWYVVSRDGMLAYVFLAFIASAGIFYISALPAIVSALIDGLGFTDQQAGYAVSANAYGSMTGALLAVLLVRRVPWKKAVGAMFVFMIAIELASTQITSPSLMIGWRFLAGVLGGCSVGFGLAILARLSHPDKAYGALLVLQFGMGGLIIYLRLLVEPYLGVTGVFVMLAILVAISLLWLPLLGAYETDESENVSTSKLPPLTTLTILTLLGIFLYQASGNGMWAFVERIGVELELPAGDVSTVVAWATWMGAVGAFIPIILGLKFGRFPLIVLGVLMSAGGVALLYSASSIMPLLLGAVSVNMAWSFTLAYLLGLSAHYDETGQLAALGGTASKFGLATGPLIATTLITDGNFGPVLIVSAIGFLLCLIVSTLPARHADKASEGTPS